MNQFVAKSEKTTCRIDKWDRETDKKENKEGIKKKDDNNTKAKKNSSNYTDK